MLGKDKKLLSNLRRLNLDLRQTKNGRWYDQKVTPDVMSCICDAIINHQNNTNSSSFTIKDLQISDFFVELMVRDFGKPSPRNPGSANEYDKVVGQPLNVLESANILKIKSHRPKTYQIASSINHVLCKMAGNEQDTAEFLNAYITEVIRQSGLTKIFDDFFTHQDTRSFGVLKQGYCDFIKSNTDITGDYEPRRIFSKVLNILAYFRRTKGAIGGKRSQFPITLNDIRYNRINFRDLIKNKPKNIPRRQRRALVSIAPSDSIPTRHIKNTIDSVKNFHGNTPEIEDEFSSVDCHSASPVEGHHIFPKSDFPQFSTFRENIILLTQTQHAGQAHGGPGKTVSLSYQHLCLQKKIEAIKKCDADGNCTFYSFRLFKGMLFVVGIIENKEDVTNFLFDDVLRVMVRYYSIK